MNIPINYLAVLVAAVANMALGALWYGPLFGKAWMRLAGMSAEMMKDPRIKAKAKRGYMWGFVSSLVMAYVLAHLLNLVLVFTVAGGLQLAFWVWLGFIATTQLSRVLWTDTPFNLYLLDVVYNLASLMLMAAVLVRMG